MGSSFLPFHSGAGVSHLSSNTTFFIVFHFDTTIGKTLGRIQTQVVPIRKKNRKQHLQSSTAFCVFGRNMQSPAFLNTGGLRSSEKNSLVYPLFDSRLLHAASADAFRCF